MTINYKRLFFPALYILGCCPAMWADSISEQQAQQVATQFLNDLHRSHFSKMRGREGAVGTLASTPALAYTLQKEGQPADLYVYNCIADGADGFVIVAGDDRVTNPIVGFSDHGHFCYQDAPENLKALFAHYANQLAFLRQQPSVSTASAFQLFNSSPFYGNVIVEPLVKTKWDQDTPFNDLCPEVREGEHTVTGCVATAIAQVLAYWKYPQQGRGRHYYWWNPTPTSRFDWGGDLTGHVYDWDNMPVDYSNGYTDEQAQAVARLMSDIGVSVNMLYGYANSLDNGSMATASAAPLAKYFDYDFNTMHEIGVEIIAGYNEEEMQPKLEEFENTLKVELDASRPVLLSAYPSPETIGHEIVVDGYTDTDYFHMNFGWSGRSDGYYKMMLIDVSSSTVEGREQRPITDLVAIVGIQPANSIVRDQLSYTLHGDEAELSFVDHAGEITIPENITDDQGKSYPVTSISCFAIQDNDTLTQVNLPNTIAHIPEYAFANSGLTSIVFPSAIQEVPAHVCQGCQDLRSVGISEGINKIGDSSFEDCPSLIMVSSQASMIGNKAFVGAGLQTYNMSMVRTIGDNAFAGCPFKKLSFEVLESVGDNAFSRADEVYLGAGVTTDNLNWLPYSMERLSVSLDNPLYVSVNNTVYDRAFTTLYYSGRDATDVYEDTDHSSGLHMVQVTSDGPRSALIIPETVTRIAPWSLKENSSIKLVIPASVTEMSGNNIYYREVYDYATVPQTIEDRGGAEVQGTLHVPAGCKDAYAAADGWKNYTSIVDDLPAPGHEQTFHASATGVYVITRHWWNQFVIKNSPVLYFEMPFSDHPSISYEDDGSFVVSSDNGVSYYERNDKVNKDSYAVWMWDDQDGLVKLSFFNDGTGGGATAVDNSKVATRVVVDGHEIRVEGAEQGAAIHLYAADGRVVASGSASANGRMQPLGVSRPGLYILKVGASTYKLSVK